MGPGWMQTWSQELEAYAAEYAANLTGIHHSSHQQRCNVPGGVGRVAGENIYSAWYSPWDHDNPTDQVMFLSWASEGWCNERVRYNYATGEFEGSKPGHFTQVTLHSPLMRPFRCPSPRLDQPSAQFRWRGRRQRRWVVA